ncbi:hypothetical protein HY643_01520 [Candidatus Woesearchaeota archaeon]|nr:hypothetical protein [Candidatus Woesearchaeota archaeon]
MTTKKIFYSLASCAALATLTASDATGKIIDFDSAEMQLKFAADDGKITIQEIVGLRDLYKLPKDRETAVASKQELKSKVIEGLNKDYAALEKEKETARDGTYTNLLNEENGLLEKKVLIFYPNLISKGGNITYIGNDLIKPELEMTVKKIICTANDKVRPYCSEDESYAVLKILAQQNQHTISDLATIYHLMPKAWKCSTQPPNAENQLSEKAKELTNKILGRKAALQRIDAELQQMMGNGLDTELSSLIEEYLQIYIRKGNDYSVDGLCEAIKKAPSFYGMGSNDMFYLNSLSENLDGAGAIIQADNPALKNLSEKISKAAGKEVKVETNNDVKLKKVGGLNWQPSYDSVFLFGIAFPIIRNIAITALLRRKSAKIGSYGLSALAGVGNGLALSSFDSLHPLVYPIRLFATPIIIQPIRKAIFGDKNLLEDL